MAQLNEFGFQPGTSMLHALDPRFKLAFMALISLSTLQAAPPSLLLLTVTLLAVIINSRAPLGAAAGLLRRFLILFFLIFIARALSTPGSPLIEFAGLTATRQGVVDGAVVCWRLLLVILAGMALVSTTRTSEIRAAVVWFLRPFPFIPGQRVATMMSLLMRFLPFILSRAEETTAAQRARCVENRKNPFYRIKVFAMPLFRRTFEDANDLAAAMEARCYSDHRTDPALSSSPGDWTASLLVLALCLAMLLV